MPYCGLKGKIEALIGYINCSRTVMRSVRDFLSFQVYSLSHKEGYTFNLFKASTFVQLKHLNFRLETTEADVTAKAWPRSA